MQTGPPSSAPGPVSSFSLAALRRSFVVFHLAGTDDPGSYAFRPLWVGHEVLVSDSLPFAHLADRVVFLKWSTVVWGQITISSYTHPSLGIVGSPHSPGPAC